MILTFIDTETTGLDLLEHEIIEFASYTVKSPYNDNFEEVNSYETKIKPNNIENASPVALRVNGYSNHKWKHANRFEDVARDIKNIIETSDVIVGQNVIFDYNFINKAYDSSGILRPKFPKYIDTKHLANQLVHDKKIKRSSLDFLCEHYQIAFEGRAHTALVDVKRTFEVYKKLIQSSEIVYFDFSDPCNVYK